MLVAQCRMKNTTGCLVCLIQFFILCHFVSFWAQIEASSVAQEKKIRPRSREPETEGTSIFEVHMGDPVLKLATKCKEIPKN